MKYNSIWKEDVINTRSNSLKENIDVDILIIGGGMTGLNTAYQLKDNNEKIVLVEMNKIGEGISMRTTAKLTFLQENIYSKLSDNLSIDKAKLYYDSQKEAIKIIKDIIETNNIDCDLEKVKSYIFTEKDNEVYKVKNEEYILSKFGCTVKNVEKLPIDVLSKYAIYVNDTYVFNPVKYMNSIKNIIKKNIKIYENTKIIEVKKFDDYYECYTNTNIIKTKKIVFACHYPFFIKPLFIPFNTYIEKSFLLATPVKTNKKISIINLSNPIKSVRFYNNYMIFVSSVGMSCDKFNYYDREKELVTFLENNKHIEYIWSNHDIMTGDSLPIIGRINNSNMFIGTGYNTWGMTNSVIASKVISDLINNKKNRYERLFNPNRGMNKLKLVSIPINMYNNLTSYVKAVFDKNSSITYKNVNGKKIGIYKENNKEYKVYTKCPHMGCSLIFNNLEKTWDCPCHGSRFDITGKSIIGPSKYNISFDENML